MQKLSFLCNGIWAQWWPLFYKYEHMIHQQLIDFMIFWLFWPVGIFSPSLYRFFYRLSQTLILYRLFGQLSREA